MIILGLDPRTKEAMRQFFEGKVCKTCKNPAERFLANEFLCHSCTEASKISLQPEPIILQAKKRIIQHNVRH